MACVEAGQEKLSISVIRYNKNEGKEVWIVGFVKNDGKVKGKLYIESEHKAYIRTELTVTGSDSSNSVLTRTRMLERSSLRNYKNFGGKWFLQYADIKKTEFNKRLNQETIVAAEFVTTKTKADSVVLLPFVQRLSYTEIFSMRKDNYKKEFWDGNTILVQDSSLQNQITPILSQEKRKELLKDSVWVKSSPVKAQTNDMAKHQQLQKRIKLITRFGFSIGSQLLPYSIDATQLSLKHPAFADPFNVSLESVGFPLLLANEFSF